MACAEYRKVATAEGEEAEPTFAAVAERQPAGRACLQWACLLVLVLTGAVALGHDLLRPDASLLLQLRAPTASAVGGNMTRGGGRRRRRKFAMASALGRMGTSSSFLLRSHRQRRKHLAKAASRSVLLVGSHFELGNELLKGVFEDLCKKPRLALRCEAEWGGTHDLKSLAEYKGKRRLVWLDQDASTLLSTYRSVGKYASNLQLLHLLWDPREACAAQWPHTLQSNHSLLELCHGLKLEQLPPLYRRVKRDRAKGAVLQLRRAPRATPGACVRRGGRSGGGGRPFPLVGGVVWGHAFWPQQIPAPHAPTTRTHSHPPPAPTRTHHSHPPRGARPP